MADNAALAPNEAKLNITYGGEQGDLPDPIPYDATDEEIIRAATECLRDGYIPGIDAVANPDFTDFVVDRFPAKEDVPINRLSLRPKTPFGKVITVAFKDPGALDTDDISESERAALKKWVEYGEYVYIDFDLGAGTATVKEVRSMR